MNLSDRRVQIGSYLGITPISHGQIYTFQIAIPNAETIEISPERQELLEQTLTEHQSNLVSLVVRRTEAYDQEKEYEIVYGADWCIVAQALDIERLWVWVFDLTDEQAVAMKTEMEQLLGGSIQPITPLKPDLDSRGENEQPLELQLKQKLNELRELQVIENKDTNTKLQTLSQTISSENSQINHRLQQLENMVHHLTANVDKLAHLVEKLIIFLPPPPPPPPSVHKLNLKTANPQQIEIELKRIGVTKNQIKPALTAISYWKGTEGGLTWDNLEYSTRSGRDKIAGFGKSTYEKLKQIGEISEQ